MDTNSVALEQIRIINEICESYDVFRGWSFMTDEEIVGSINTTTGLLCDNWETLMKPINQRVSNHIQQMVNRFDIEWEELFVSKAKTGRDRLTLLVSEIVQGLGDCYCLKYDKYTFNTLTRAEELVDELLSKCKLWVGYEENDSE